MTNKNLISYLKRMHELLAFIECYPPYLSILIHLKKDFRQTIIPIISPGLILCKKLSWWAYFWESLFLEGLIFEGNVVYFQNGLGLPMKTVQDTNLTA